MKYKDLNDSDINEDIIIMSKAGFKQYIFMVLVSIILYYTLGSFFNFVMILGIFAALSIYQNHIRLLQIKIAKANKEGTKK